MGSKKESKGKAKKPSAKKTSSTKSAKKEETREFNPREHRIVPEHEVMDEKEVETLFERYDIDPTNLPVILASDAALSGLEIKMGDVIKITRPSLTAGTAIFYRRVAYE